METEVVDKYKHLTENSRDTIEEGLRLRLSFKVIAKQIGKDPTTVSKEVKKHIEIVKPAEVIGEEPKLCKDLLKAPFVCNGCPKRRYCALEKHFYRARPAHEKYRETLVESRVGVPLNKESFYRADEILLDGVRKGQHIYHITQSHNLGMSVSTVYRNINKGYLSVSKMDLPRAVRFKPRKTPKEEYVPPVVKRGRVYDDFLEYIHSNDIQNWTEMDTVIGNPGGKVIMTFDLTDTNLMFGLLLNNKTSAEASEKIRSLKARLLAHGVSFGSLFPLILTDNGGEFSNVHAFMDAPDGTHETELFFCDPYRSSQKPRVEKNHTLFRDIVPKGYSFDRFTQQDVNFIFSHVNSVKRKKLNNKTPYELFCFLYGTEQLSGADLAGLLGIKPILPTDVVQSPNLLNQLPSLK